MRAADLQVTSVDQIQAIGIRVLHVAEDVASASRHHGRSDRIIERRGTGGARPTSGGTRQQVTCSRF